MKLKLRYTKLPLSKAQFGYDIPGIPKKLSVPNLNIPGITPPQFVIPQGPQNFDLVNPGNISPGQEMKLNPVSGPNSFAWSNPFQAEAPSVRLNTVKRDGTTVTTGQKGNPEYTVYEQADYSQPVKQATETDLSGMQKLQKFGKKVEGLTDILSMVSTGVDYLNQRKKAKQFDRDFRRQQFDITGMASPEFEGNYDINTGMFQPYRMFNPNEGAAMAEHGGQINNTMKIRITGTPMENMAYGGQSGYGLDLGRKQVYADMPESRSESVSSSIGAVPRELANIEAEGGETVFGDLDGDGGLEHMKIRGKRHTEGGVPLNVPEGSFIFSDTKKMKIKDPAILAKFGASYKQGGVTPATIAKKYDINKYKAIMEDPNADPLAKSTAQMMVKNYQNKLAQLALVQEGMKGFPGGIPQVAQNALPEGLAQGMPAAMYGGYLEKYQDGKETTKPWSNSFDRLQQLYNNEQNKAFRDRIYQEYASYTQGKNKTPLSPEDFNKTMMEHQRQVYMLGDKYKGDPNYLNTEDWDRYYGDPKRRNEKYFNVAKENNFTPLNEDQIRAGEVGYQLLAKLATENPEFQDSFGKYVRFNAAGKGDQTSTFKVKQPDGSFKEVTYNITPETGIYGNTFNQQRIEMTEPETPEVPKVQEFRGYVCNLQSKKVESRVFKTQEELNRSGAYATEAQAAAACGVDPGKIDTGTITGGKDIFDYTAPDKLSMLASGMFGPKFQAPWSPNLSFRPNRLALQDWLAQAQAIGSNTATAANTLGTYQPGQALASNMSFLQGQAADQIGKTIAATDAGNVDRFNNFATREGMRKDQVNMLNWKNQTDLYDKGVLAKDAFQKDSIAAADRFTKSFGNAWDNRMKWYMMNTTNPIYGADPRSGFTYFKNGYGPDYFSRVAGNAGRPGANWGDMYSDYQQAKTQFPGLTEDQYFRNRNRVTETDTDGDRIPDRTTTRSVKRGGQVNPLIEFLMGGYSYDPRGY